VTSCGFDYWVSIPGNRTENVVFITFRRAVRYPQPQDTGNPLLLCVGLIGGTWGTYFNAPFTPLYRCAQFRICSWLCCSGCSINSGLLWSLL